MWPFDLIWRLFGGKPTEPEVARPPSIEDRLAEFVDKEESRPAAAEPAREKTGSREMIEAARKVVDVIQNAFQGYVNDKVLRRFPKDFRLEVPNLAQMRDLDKKFGDTKTGNEYRYARVAFKDRFAIVLRAQAMILSRDVEIRVLFLELRTDGPFHTQEVDLLDSSSLDTVKWDQVYEKVILEFLNWHRAVSSKSG